MKLSVILEIFPNGWEVNKNPYQSSRISYVRFCTISNSKITTAAHSRLLRCVKFDEGVFLEL